MTQVSFDPPPWEELTINEPRFSATRLNPPGSTQTDFPVSAKGRRSTCLGSMFLPIKVGQTESETIGWLMKLAGSAFILVRNAFNSRLDTRGPTTTPYPPRPGFPTWWKTGI